MIRFYINQKRNNVFLNIFNEYDKKIYFNSIGSLEYSKKADFFTINLLIENMFSFFNEYIQNNYIKYNGFLYYNFIKRKEHFFFKMFRINIFLNLSRNFEDFLNPIFKNFLEYDLKYNNFFFLNKFPHGGCKLKKKYIKLKKKK